MTSPLTPETVAQMVADREIGTNGPWTFEIDEDTQEPRLYGDGSLIAVFGNHMSMSEAAWIPEADARRATRLPDLEAAYLTLAAENATLRHDRDVAVVNNDVLRIAMDTLRAERDDLKSAMTPTPDAELDAFVDFMCGAGEFDGAWFGDDHHSLSGHFWWRTRLRKTIATLRASEAAALERAEKLFGLLQTVRDYVSDAASGELKFDKGVSIQDMAVADLKLIDAALTPTADKE